MSLGLVFCLFAFVLFQYPQIPSGWWSAVSLVLVFEVALHYLLNFSYFLALYKEHAVC